MIKYGIVGFGRIGQRHARAIQSVENAVLVAVSDPEIEQSQSPVPLYADLKSMVSAESPDVICVCTPNHLHGEVAIEALNYGCHVVCEKPLTLSYEEAVRMVELANEKNRYLSCVLQNRYSPQATWLKKVIDSGDLGHILQVQVSCLWNRDDRYFLNEDGERHPWHGRLEFDGGPLFTQFSHFIDLLVWLFGTIEPSNALFANFTHKHSIDFEDSGKFDMQLPNGGFGVFQYSIAVWDKNQESSITLVGTKGSVKLGGQYMNSVEYGHFEGFVPPDFPEASANNHALVIKNMTNTVAGVSDLDFPVEHAVEGVRIIEQVYKMREHSR